MSIYYSNWGSCYDNYNNQEYPYPTVSAEEVLNPKKKKFEQLTRVKIDKLQFLGEGANGSVYKAGRTKSVIKITNSKDEATFCQHLKTKRTSRAYLPKINFVYKVDNKFVIGMEELKPVEDLDISHKLSLLMWSSPPPFTAKYHTYIRKMAREKPDLKKYCVSADRFFAYLKSLGINKYDHHLGNLMYRTSTKDYVFIDYGYIGLPKKFVRSVIKEIK